MIRTLTLAAAFTLAPLAAMAQSENPVSPAEQIVVNDRFHEYDQRFVDYDARIVALDERLRLLEELNENPGTPPSREGFAPEGEADTDRVLPAN